MSINGAQVCHGGVGDDRNLVVTGRQVLVEIDRTRRRRGQPVDQRPDPRVRPRELGLQQLASTRSMRQPATGVRVPRPLCFSEEHLYARHPAHPDGCRTAQGGGPDRGPAVDPAFRGNHHGHQVRRQRHDQRGPAPRLRRGHRLPAPRGHQSRGGARRRPADQLDAQPPRDRIRVQGRAAGDHPGNHGRGPHGAHRAGAARTHRPDQLARPLRRGTPARRRPVACHAHGDGIDGNTWTWAWSARSPAWPTRSNPLAAGRSLRSPRWPRRSTTDEPTGQVLNVNADTARRPWPAR